MRNCSGQASQGAECINTGNTHGCQSRKRHRRRWLHSGVRQQETQIPSGPLPEPAGCVEREAPSLELSSSFQGFCSGRAQIQLGYARRGCSPSWRLSLLLRVGWRTLPVSPQHPSTWPVLPASIPEGRSKRNQILTSISSSCGFSEVFRAPTTSLRCSSSVLLSLQSTARPWHWIPRK